MNGFGYRSRHASSARRVVITGAASGIGAATALLFAEKGDRVVGIDIDGDGMQSGGLELGLECDVRDCGDLQKAVEGAAEALDGIDVVISAAGQVVRARADRLGLEAWDHHFEINARAPFVLARAALPHLRSSDSPRIVIVASQLGLVAAPDVSAYCASKGAAVQLAKALALDFSTFGITVNAVCPGPTDTPMLRSDIAGSGESGALRELVETTPIGRLIEPSEVAASIAYLASAEAAAVTGTALVIDGGYTTA